MQTNVAGGTEHYQVVLSVVPISADLTLSVIQSWIYIWVSFVLGALLLSFLSLCSDLQQILLSSPLF